MGDREDETDEVQDPDIVQEGDMGSEDATMAALQELVSQYKSALVELTFNSKPIITNLTIIAGENAHAAKGISSTICAHILEAPKEQKLPSLYLLDSIVKNIGGEYVKYFSARLPEVFCRSYRQVDPGTYPAMQHLFRTWRGVFPAPPLSYIEEQLQFSSIVNGSTASTAPSRPIESQSPRTGHGMHGNPKYIEAAHRQRIGQSNRVSQRGEDVFGELGFVRNALFEATDYDIPSNSRPSVSRKAETDAAWEDVWSGELDGEGVMFSGEGVVAGLLHPQNGYDGRQLSSRKLPFDGYGYNRGPGPGTGGTLFHGLDSEHRKKIAGGHSQQFDDEDYAWKEMSSKAREKDHMVLSSTRNYWLSGDSERGPARGVGRSKLPVQNAGTATSMNWSRQRHFDQQDLNLVDERLPLSRDLEERDHPHLRTVFGSRDGVGDLQVTLDRSLRPDGTARMRSSVVGLPSRNMSPSRLGLADMALPLGSVSMNSAGSEGLDGIGGLSVNTSIRSQAVGGSSALGHLSPVTPGAQFHHRQRSTSPLRMHPQSQVQQLSAAPPPPLPPGHQSQVLSSQRPQSKQIKSLLAQTPHYQLPSTVETQTMASLQHLQHIQQLQQSQSVVALQRQQAHIAQTSSDQSQGSLSKRLIPGSQGTGSDNLLAAFLQSGLLPPSQTPQGSASRLTLNGSLSALPTVQRQPPSSSGSLSAGYSLPIGLVSGGLNGATGSSSLNLRYPQVTGPPSKLRPGNLSDDSTVSRSAAPAMNQFSSLLTSLVARGLIGAPQSSVDTPPVPSRPPSLVNTGLDSILGSIGNHSSSVVHTVTDATMSDAVPYMTDSWNEVSIGNEFKQELLRERNESVINALYVDFPRQCKTCGLRFNFQEDHSKHMDWHVSRNRRPQKKTSRKWFASVKEWLSGTGASATDVAPMFFSGDAQVKVEDQDILAVPSDENQRSCALCGEPFEDFYSDETDEWMFKGAVYMNVLPGHSVDGLQISQLGPIVHAKCRTESEATAAAAASSEEDDGVQPELLAGTRERDSRGGDGMAASSLKTNFENSGLKDDSEDSGGKRKRIRY